MDINAAILQSEFVRSEHAQTLTERLRRRNFEWLVEGPHPHEARLQGDLFDALPVSFVDPQGNSKSAVLPSMVINNTCDLQPQRSKFVTVATAFD